MAYETDGIVFSRYRLMKASVALLKKALYAALVCLAAVFVPLAIETCLRWMYFSRGQSLGYDGYVLLYGPHVLLTVLLQHYVPDLRRFHFYVLEFGPLLYMAYALAGFLAYRTGVLRTFTYATVLLHNVCAAAAQVWLCRTETADAGRCVGWLVALVVFIGLQALVIMAVRRIEPTSRAVRLQYSLRSLLLVMVVVSLLAGYVATLALRVCQGRRLMAMFEKACEEYEDGLMVTLRIGCEGERTALTESHFNDIAKMPRLRSLTMEYCQIDAAGFTYLAKAPRLRELSLRGCTLMGPEESALQALAGLESLEMVGPSVTDTTVEHLATLGSLRRLKVGGAISNRSCDCIAAMTWLEELELYGPAVDDEGVALLTALVNLRKLSPIHTSVTDRGLTSIALLEKLKELDVRRMDVTDAGLEALRLRRPDVKILRPRRTTGSSEVVPWDESYWW